MKKTLSILLAAAMLLALTACGGGSGGDTSGAAAGGAEKTSITFADVGWDSIKLNNALAGLVAESAFGYKWQETPGSTPISHEALIKGDPEVDIEQFGMRVEGLKKVFLTPNQQVAYGVTLNEHVFLPDGTEKEVRPETSTTCNIASDGLPIRWTGKMIPRKKAMRMFVFRKSYQVQHVNGLTYDFLFDMAKKLADADAMMLVGGGQKGVAPLVMSNGGTPYRAFLEGRVEGERYALILRLTNMELKSIV